MVLKRPAWSRYVIAVFAVALAAAVRVTLLGSLGTRAPFLTFYPAVILAALGGGLPGGLLATALSALAVNFACVEPVGQFSIRDPADWLAVGVFVMACAMISSVTGAMQRAQTRASTAESQVKLAMERSRADEDLHRYKLLAEHSRDIILYIRREDGRILDANAAAKAYGYTRDELRSLSIHELRDADTQVSTEGQMAEADTAGIVFETVHRRKDGSTFPVEVSSQGATIGGTRTLVSVIRDITDRKRAEARLRDAQKLESLGLLAGGVAHDFNNLLVGVIGNASLAQEMLPPSHPAAEFLAGILSAGEQAAHLTRQMLAYSGKGRFVVEPLDLSALIPEMSDLVRPSISKKITLLLDLEKDLPAIEADRGQVQQVFMNLALNAAEAIGNHEGRITVRTGVQDVDLRYVRLRPETAALAPARYVCLEVRDTGCGMDEATQAKMFDPFFSTKFLGRGLGLAAVAGIVRGHKGAILITSAPGQGSCFTVLFPAGARAPEESPAAVHNTALRGTGTVLVVDDESMVREMVRRALESQGYTVLLADSGLTAIDVCRRHPGEIALVVLDLSMPHMSGAEAVPELWKIRPEVKVVVSSGYSESETMTLFKGQPVSGFIQKPYTSKGIAEKVKVCLG